MKGDREMRSLLGTATPRYRTQLYRREPELAELIRAAPPEARKTFVTGGIGLPQLDGGVRHRIAVAVDDGAGERNPRPGGPEPGQIGPFRVLDQVPEGPDRLAARGARHDYASIGVASRPRSTTSKR